MRERLRFQGVCYTCGGKSVTEMVDMLATQLSQDTLLDDLTTQETEELQRAVETGNDAVMDNVMAYLITKRIEMEIDGGKWVPVAICLQ